MSYLRRVSTAALALFLALTPATAWAGPDQDKDWIVTRQHVDAPIPIWHDDTNSFSLNTINLPMEKTALWIPKAWTGTSEKDEAKSQLVIPAKRPDLAFLGSEGAVLNAAPQNPGPGNTPIWAGLGAGEVGDADKFEGETYTLDLISVDGPGRMEMFIDNGDSVNRFLSSHDTAYRSVYNPRHSHMYTTFTQPGRYVANYKMTARSADGMRIRGAFVAGEGFESLMSADYSQIEMRLMAHLSGDEALIEAFNSGEDLHRTMASMVFGTPVAEVSAEERSRIKATSYGLAYGLSSYGLAAQLSIPVPEAAALRDRYFERFGKVRDYLEGLVAQARADGYTQTMFGRRRYLPDLRSSNRQRREMAERAALNAPIQGSAADIVKIAMMNVVDALSEAGLKSRLLVQIHDELLLEVAPGEAGAVEEIVRDKMATPVELSVPLDVAVGIGASWQLAAH